MTHSAEPQLRNNRQFGPLVNFQLTRPDSPPFIDETETCADWPMKNCTAHSSAGSFVAIISIVEIHHHRHFFPIFVWFCFAHCKTSIQLDAINWDGMQRPAFNCNHFNRIESAPSASRRATSSNSAPRQWRPMKQMKTSRLDIKDANYCRN